MSYNVRINDNFLKADYVDGEVLQHTDLNELESVVKTAINANYEDIQKLQDGTLSSGNASKLSNATLSTLLSETLQNSDSKIPTSAQAKNYIDSAISSIDLSGYAVKNNSNTFNGAQTIESTTNSQLVLSGTNINDESSIIYEDNSGDEDSYVVGCGTLGIKGFGIYSWKTQKNVFHVDKYGNIEIANTVKTKGTGNVATQTLGEGLQIKEATSSEAPNNGIVLEYSKYSGFGGQLYIPDNDTEGIWYNGWHDGTRGTWRQLVLANALSTVATSGSYNDLSNKPDLSVYATTTQLGTETTNRQNADNNLQGQIDALTSASDVVDIVSTYSDLQNYDTSKLTNKDVIKVMQDSTHSNALSYYRWTVVSNVGSFVYVGSEGPFYTKSETDTLLSNKVGFNDYATSSTSGVILVDSQYGVQLEYGKLCGVYKHYYDTHVFKELVSFDTILNVINEAIITQGTSAPTTSTVGYRIGQLYIDTTNNKTYQLTAIDNGTYTWVQLIRENDYATSSVGGVIKTTSNVGTSMSNGYLVLQTKNYSEYTNAGNNLFISKGTLENVLDARIGSIDSVLDAINGEVQ